MTSADSTIVSWSHELGPRVTGSKGSSKLLKFYMLLTVIAVGLSLIPFASGHYVGKARNSAYLGW